LIGTDIVWAEDGKKEVKSRIKEKRRKRGREKRKGRVKEGSEEKR